MELWSARHNENPVQVDKQDGKWVVKNECGEVLSTCSSSKLAWQWCHDNFCRPINKSWSNFFIGGY